MGHFLSEQQLLLFLICLPRPDLQQDRHQLHPSWAPASGPKRPCRLVDSVWVVGDPTSARSTSCAFDTVLLTFLGSPDVQGEGPLSSETLTLIRLGALPLMPAIWREAHYHVQFRKGEPGTSELPRGSWNSLLGDLVSWSLKWGQCYSLLCGT